MTITISLWMLIPALLILGGLFFVVLCVRAGSGLMAGMFEGLAAIALFAMAGVFLLGRWLA